MRNVVAVILGGGRGTRLQPLTTHRSKPAVPLAGKYRLIDIPISNCINSGINRCFVLTQFLSVSLHGHIRGTYRFDAFSGGIVEILAAQQTLYTNDDTSWYQGTADAVRKNLRYFTDHRTEYVLILSGDQLYRMDFQAMIETHKDSGAAITIAAKPVHRHEATGLGIMKVDDSGRIVGFVEKPTTAAQLDEVAMDPAWIDSLGVTSAGRECMASMGIYLFSVDVLVEALNATSHSDFGKELLPRAIEQQHVQLHPFDGYWEDIGTIGSFYEANLALTKPDAPFHLSEADAPIYSRPRFLPPTRRWSPHQVQPDCRWVHHPPRGKDRKQHYRPPLPDRVERIDPRLDCYGCRLFRDTRAGGQECCQGWHLARHRRGGLGRTGDRRQELPHRCRRKGVLSEGRRRRSRPRMLRPRRGTCSS